MTEIKLGDKYECFNCGVKFYDLGKGAPICPKCGADQEDAEAKDNPLMAQSVKRKRKAELLPDADAGGDEATPLDEDDLDEEDLEIDEEDLEEGDEVEDVEVVEEEAHEA